LEQQKSGIDNGLRVCENKYKEYFLCFNFFIFVFPTNMNQELVDYIKQQMKVNVSKNKIVDVLSEQGWRQSEIDEAFSAASGSVGAARVGGFGENQFEGDGLENATRAGANRKTIMYVAAGLVVLAIFATIIILPSLGVNKENSTIVNTPKPVAVTGNDVRVNTVATSPAADSQNAASESMKAQISAGLMAEIKKLETSIQPPAGWVEREGTVRARPLAVFFKPTTEKDSLGKDVYNENISISEDIYKSTEITDPDGYVAKAKSIVQSSIPSYKMATEKKVKLEDGTVATLIGGSLSQNGLALKSMQLYAFKGGNVYVITGIVAAANWNKEKDAVGAAVMSFKFPADN
jgi:hypothetical protein